MSLATCLPGPIGVLGFDLLRPELALLLFVLPLLVLVALWSLGARKRARLALVSTRHLERFLPGFSENRARLRVLLACGAVLGLVLAMLGPVRGYTLRDMRRRGLDLVLCLDTSRSMLVQDLKPDRLTRAKRSVKGLLGMLADDRAALLAFAGDVRAVAPLTHDRVTLGHFVETLDTEENLRGGTDIGGVLEHALGLFDGRTGAHEAIVLITDGEDLEARGREIAERAALDGIRIYVVGMGTAAGGKIPGERGFVRDGAGKEVVSKLDGTSLQTIADLTGGAYLSAEDSPIPLEELFDKRISNLEGRNLDAGKERVPHDRYQWPLVIAVACMLGELGLRERRGRERSNRVARRATRSAASLVLLLGLAVPGFAAQSSPSPTSTSPVQDGVQAEEEADREPFRGSVAEGLTEIERLSDASNPYEAVRVADDMLGPTAFARWRAKPRPEGFVRSSLDVADPLFEGLGLLGRPRRVRGAIHYAKGVTLTRSFERGIETAAQSGLPDDEALGAIAASADGALQSARSLSGAGQGRQAAIYNLGFLDLIEGDRQRSRIPELGGQPSGASGLPSPGLPTPGLPPGAQPSGGQEEEQPPDPLELARAAYGLALEHFVERLREDWRDADTRANVELIQRRLDELDEIERKREEQEQEQEDSSQQNQDSDQQNEDEQNQENQDSQDQNQEQESQDDSESEDESESDEPEEPEEPEQPETPEEGQDEPEEQPPQEQPAEQQPEERLLTTEELKRLLDRLNQLEQKGEEVRAQIRQTRRAKVEKDW